MSLITASHDSLPYIDRPPTPNSTSAAHALIKSSLAPSASTQPHPLLPDPPSIPHSPLIQSELARIAAKLPMTGTDLSRYEASPHELSPTTSLAEAREMLKAAYTNASYLTLRLQALALLERFGKNAWLVGNMGVEEGLRDVERELVACRGRVEGCNRERREGQEGGRAGLEGGEVEWRRRVGEVVEVGVEVGGLEGKWREGLRGRGGG